MKSFKLFLILSGIVLFLANCSTETDLGKECFLSEKPHSSYKAGIVADTRTGKRSFAIRFTVDRGRLQAVKLQGTWLFRLKNGEALLRLKDSDFDWEVKANELIGRSKVDLSNYLAQTGVRHEIKSLTYELLIDGMWWNY